MSGTDMRVSIRSAEQEPSTINYFTGGTERSAILACCPDHCDRTAAQPRTVIALPTRYESYPGRVANTI